MLLASEIASKKSRHFFNLQRESGLIHNHGGCMVLINYLEACNALYTTLESKVESYFITYNMYRIYHSKVGPNNQ